ncbi:carbohydrate sulfotransferase 10-like [Macrobrachium rosenbergii]|uniref:carbohydrate sulfotransferase 10-like n=1 Tax=Macrobrachium rosenbergii TaxID=79674 RepID=UPI0034D761FD
MMSLASCKRESLTVRKAILLAFAIVIYNYVMFSRDQKPEKDSGYESNNSSSGKSSPDGVGLIGATENRTVNVTASGIRTYTFKMRGKKNQTSKQTSRKKHFLEDKVVVMDDVWTEEKMAAQAKIFADRAAELATSCEELRDDSVFLRNISAIHANLRWVPKHKLIWCPVYKAASTTWMSNLLLLAGMKSASNSFHKQVKKLYPPPKSPEERQRLLETSMRMLIVRHPLERLLSAYRDKMLRGDQFQRLSHAIKTKYPDPDIDEDATHPTFHQFLLHIRDNMKKFWSSEGTSKVNPHWQPVWWTCGPCQIMYDAIAHMETLTADQEYIIRKAGLRDLAVNAHTHSSNLDSFKGTDEATFSYFSKIPKKLIQQVSNLYRHDFQLFGYSPDKFIAMGTK